MEYCQCIQEVDFNVGLTSMQEVIKEHGKKQLGVEVQLLSLSMILTRPIFSYTGFVVSNLLREQRPGIYKFQHTGYNPQQLCLAFEHTVTAHTIQHLVYPSPLTNYTGRTPVCVVLLHQHYTGHSLIHFKTYI